MVSKVYFANMRANSKQNLFDKLEKLFDIAGMHSLVSPKDLVALKVHFGERGNTGYVRPQFIRRLVDKVKRLEGKPFITAVLPGSRLEGKGDVADKFRALWPDIDWSHQLRYGEEIGLGSRKYELIEVK